MKRLVLAASAAAVSLMVFAGCSASSAGWTAFSVGKNLSKKDTNLRVFLDGQEAKQNKLRKGLMGYSPFEIKTQVSGSPKFKYELIDAGEHGFIKHVMMQVHQKYEADFSDLADYVIHPRDMNNPDNNMKPGVTYDLGALGPQFRIMDKKDQEVSAVQFQSGKEYLLVFTISADKSESVQIYFETN